MSITTAINELVHATYELFASVLGGLYHLFASVFGGLYHLFSSFFIAIARLLEDAVHLFTDAIGGVLAFAGDAGKLVLGNIVLIGLAVAASFLYVTYRQQQGRPVKPAGGSLKSKN